MTKNKPTTRACVNSQRRTPSHVTSLLRAFSCALHSALSSFSSESSPFSLIFFPDESRPADDLLSLRRSGLPVPKIKRRPLRSRRGFARERDGYYVAKSLRGQKNQKGIYKSFFISDNRGCLSAERPEDRNEIISLLR